MTGIHAGTRGSGAPTIISKQSFQIAITGTGTSNTGSISSVDIAEAVLSYQGVTTDSTINSANAEKGLVRMTLTNATTITIVRFVGGTNMDILIRGTVIEYASGTYESMQYGSVTMTGVSDTDTISSVVTAKANVEFLGYQGSNNNSGDYATDLTLTDSTTVTATKDQGGGSDVIINYVVWELK